MVQDPLSIMPRGGASGQSLFFPIAEPKLVTVRSALPLDDGGECGELPEGPREIFASEAQSLELVHFVSHFSISP